MTTYTVRWVSDYATITSTVETHETEDAEIFSLATSDFVAWHGFNPTDHGFHEDEVQEM